MCIPSLGLCFPVHTLAPLSPRGGPAYFLLGTDGEADEPQPGGFLRGSSSRRIDHGEPASAEEGAGLSPGREGKRSQPGHRPTQPRARGCRAAAASALSRASAGHLPSQGPLTLTPRERALKEAGEGTVPAQGQLWARGGPGHKPGSVEHLTTHAGLEQTPGRWRGP